MKNKKKILVSITGVTLALLLLVGSNLGLFAQATEAQSIASSSAVEEKGESVDSEQTAENTTSEDSTQEQASSAESSEAISSESQETSETVSSTNEDDSKETEASVFAAADAIGVTVAKDASHQTLDNSSVSSPIIYSITISNKDLVNSVIAGTTIKLSLEGGIIVGTSSDTFLTNARSGSTLTLTNGQSELKNFETGFNIPINSGSGLSFTVRAYSTAPTDMKLKVEVTGESEDGTALSTTYTDVLSYEADYGYIKDLPDYQHILGYGHNFGANNLTIGGSSKGANAKTSFWNSTDTSKIGYMEDYQVFRKLSEEDAVNLQTRNNGYSTLTSSLGIDFRVPYTLQQDSNGTWEMVWDFGEIGPVILLNGFATINSYNNYVDPSFFTTAYIGKTYTFYDGIRDGSTIFNDHNNNATGSVTIVEDSTGPTVETASDYAYGLYTAVNNGMIYESTKKAASVKISYWFTPGNLSPTDLPFSDVTTIVNIPDNIEVYSIQSLNAMKVNKVEGNYNGVWKTLIENQSDYISDATFVLATEDIAPSQLRFTANEWTNAINAFTTLGIGVDDSVITDTDFLFTIDSSSYKTAINSNTTTKQVLRL